MAGEDELLHAAMSGPSACNKRPWQFYVITNEKLLETLKTASKFTKISAKRTCGKGEEERVHYIE